MTDTTTLDAGISYADGPEMTKEFADVAAWFLKYKNARTFDESARKQYAKDRRYARGDSGFQVDANIIGTFIDITESFLFAKQPDVDVLPARASEPPALDSLREAAEDGIDIAAVTQAGQVAAVQMMLAGVDEQMALQAGAMAEEAKAEELIMAEVDRLQKAFSRRQADSKQYAETLELIVSHHWRAANLKKRGRRWTRSGITVGVGVIKASWQHRTEPAPETVSAINDMHDNIKRAAGLRADLEEGNAGFIATAINGVKSLFGTDAEAKMADYERQLAALKGQAERVVFRGFVTDNVQAEDFTVAPGYTIADHTDAPWNAHRIPMLYSDAKAFYGLDEDKMKAAVRYSARKPEMIRTTSAMVDTIEATDADAYTTAETSADGPVGGEWVMLVEFWDRDSSTVLTGIEGVKCWAKPAWQPKPTSRFYPFFLFCTAEIDGQRHPQSLVTRASKLVDEYYRIGSAEATHRKRCIPKTAFNASAMDDEEVKKLEKATTQEMVAIKTLMPIADLRGLLVPVAYAAIDPALYDRTRIRNEIEMIFGTQEALQGAVTVQKTLGEAEIMQQGFNARTNGRRDHMETALGELALFTAETLRAYLSHEDVIAICGPGALWPEYSGAEDLSRMVSVDVRAGTSGKPNTTAEREAWSMLLPLLDAKIGLIAQLRGSSPADLADAHEMLLRITIERAGDRLDVDTLLPKPGPAPMPGMPGDPNAMSDHAAMPAPVAA